MSCQQRNVPTGDVPCCLDICNSNMQDDMQALNCFYTRGIRLTGFSPIHISEGRRTRRGSSTSLTSMSIARFPSSPDTSPRLGASATFAADGTLSYYEIAPESCSLKRTCWMMVSPTLTPPFPETSFPSTASLSTNMTTLSFLHHGFCRKQLQAPNQDCQRLKFKDDGLFRSRVEQTDGVPWNSGGKE